MNKTNLEKYFKEKLIAIRGGAFITPFLKELMALIVCSKCYGKGYGTQTLFAQEGMPDFGPDNGKRRATKLPQMVFCDCSRGKQLMELWHEGEEIIVRAAAEGRIKLKKKK